MDRHHVGHVFGRERTRTRLVGQRFLLRRDQRCVDLRARFDGRQLRLFRLAEPSNGGSFGNVVESPPADPLDVHEFARQERRDVAVAVEHHRPAGPLRRVGQDGRGIRIGGSEPYRSFDLRLQLLYRGGEIIEFVVEDTSAKRSGLLKVGRPLHDQPPAQCHLDVRRRRCGEGDAATLAFADALDRKPGRHLFAVEIDLEVGIRENREREQELASNAVRSILDARLDGINLQMTSHDRPSLASGRRGRRRGIPGSFAPGGTSTWRVRS